MLLGKPFSWLENTFSGDMRSFPAYTTVLLVRALLYCYELALSVGKSFYWQRNGFTGGEVRCPDANCFYRHERGFTDAAGI